MLQTRGTTGPTRAPALPVQDQISTSGIELQQHGCGMGAFLLEGGQAARVWLVSGEHAGRGAGGACGAAVPPWPWRGAPGNHDDVTSWCT
jgi:hypothetical protein